jgi:acetyl esterase/lipase
LRPPEHRFGLVTRRAVLGAIGLSAAAVACGNGGGRKADVSTDIIRLTESYGTDRLNVGEWFVPVGEKPVPAVVLIHGGFWRKQYDRHLEDKLALDLAGRGYLCWNLDYRSSAVPWPATLTDVAAGYDFLRQGRFGDRVIDGRVAVVGHSAGGQLAAWLASRDRLKPEAPGYNADVVLPDLAVPQAGVVALAIAAEDGLGGGAPQALVGGSPSHYPERYDAADPMSLLPSSVRSVLIHDRNDDVVPLSQSQTYVAAATKAGDKAGLIVTSGDHFSHLDPASESCAKLRDALATMKG